MTASSRFVFVCCQFGAEAACKQEVIGHHPEFRLAFSRPGFLTFKVPESVQPGSFVLISTFARTWGWSLGQARGADGQTLARQVAGLAQDLKPAVLHIWQRDWSVPGNRGFEPGITPLAAEAGKLVLAELANGAPAIQLNRRAKPGEVVFDVIMVEPNEWWGGWHVSETIAQSWPGGIPPIQPDESMISRAWMKICEALMWGQVPLRAGDVCAEIGSAPGGAAQYLLQKGMQVIAIDPAELDPAILNHPKLNHIRRRARDVPHRELTEVRWLITDINMPPSYTLDVIEDYIANRHMHVRGVVATLKLTDWDLAKEIDSYRERIRKLGFSVVRTRQLAFNRQEFCLVALRNKFERRLAKSQKRSTPAGSRVDEKIESPSRLPESQTVDLPVESDSKD